VAESDGGQNQPFVEAALRQAPSNAIRGNDSFSPAAEAYSKMWLRRSSPVRCLFAVVLARLFLEKAGRYEVRLTAKDRSAAFINLARTAGNLRGPGIPRAKRIPVRPTRLFTRSML
jgi:hypothetical protein